MPEIQKKERKLFTKQDQFIFGIEDKPTRFMGYGGGFGNGKTFAGIIKAYNHCQQPNAYFLIGRRNASDLTDSTMRDFAEHIGHLGKFISKNGRPSFIFPNGSEVIFRHLNDLQSLTNMNLSGFWIDQAEEVSEDAFAFLVGRLRRPVQWREGFITFNMNGHDWIWRRFLKKLGQDGKVLEDAEDYTLVVAATLENQANLPADYIKSLMAMGGEYVKRFVYGSFDTFAGQVYDEFNQSIHVIPPFEIPEGWVRYRSIDHGQTNPTACGWFAVDYDGNVFCYREYYQPNDIVSNHVAAINALSAGEKYSYTLIDPSTTSKTRERNGIKYSVADEYMEAGITTIPGQNDVIAGINRVKEYLHVDPDHLHPVTGERGSPRLFFFQGLTDNHIEEHAQYRWKQAVKLSGDPNRDDIKEAPVKRQDHSVDETRYFIMSRPPVSQMKEQLEPWMMKDPLELARRAQREGVTTDDLLYRSHQSGIRHSDSTIGHQDSLNIRRAA